MLNLKNLEAWVENDEEFKLPEHETKTTENEVKANVELNEKEASTYQGVWGK